MTVTHAPPFIRSVRIFLGALVVFAATSGAALAQRLPAGFVYLRDVDPTIVQDMRYAGPNNFVGRRLGGTRQPNAW